MRFNKLIQKLRYFSDTFLSKIEISFLLQYHFFYRNYLKIFEGLSFKPRIPQNIKWGNTTLKNKEELNLAIKEIKKSNLNLHPKVPEKNWDSLIALNIILQNTDQSAYILDAGGQKNSLILHWLYQFDYSNLKAINLVFENRKSKGKIEFIPGDITNTPFPDKYFDIITCLSVIEHGVDEDQFLIEMHRILKDGGLLIISTDYWEQNINIGNLYAYNHPIFVYNKDFIKRLLKKAITKGFKIYGPKVDLSCEEKVVNWRKFNISFTFLIFSLQKE